MDDKAKYRNLLGQTITASIDRPLGSKHPTHDFLYPVNYGFVPDTLAGDGDPIDAYILGVDGPLRSFTGQCIAVVYRRDDNEHKLIVANKPFSSQRIMDKVGFVEDYYDTTIEMAADA